MNVENIYGVFKKIILVEVWLVYIKRDRDFIKWKEVFMDRR